jgi:uncharacterized protein YgfB (UPF0149 family)
MKLARAADPHANWSAVLARAKLGVAPSELHGSITGFLCAGWGGSPRELLASLALDDDAVDTQAGGDLEALLESATRRIAGRLRAREPVELLLPEGSLAARANAAVDWCRGFLGGLGLTGALVESAKTAPVADLLSGLGQIAASHLACDDDDEAALDDVLDFVRDAVVQLHAAFAPSGQP